MTHERFTIRQLCDEFAVTPRALRFYEAKELLAPEREGTRRLYSRRDRARLKLILRGKRFGFTLEEIRQLLNLYDIGDQQVTQLSRTYEIAMERRQIMEAQRDELDSALNELDQQLDLVRGVLAERGAPPAAGNDAPEPSPSPQKPTI